MVIENLSLGQISLALAFVVGLVKSIDFIFDRITKPHDKLKQQHEEDIEKIKKELEEKADRKIIEEIKKDIKVILKMELANTEHNLYGNHIEDMQKEYEKLKEHLIES